VRRDGAGALAASRGLATFPAAGFYAMLCAAFLLAVRCLMIPLRLLAMSSTLLLTAALAGAAPPASTTPAKSSAPATPAAPMAGAAAAGSPSASAAGRRIEIPSPEGKPYPYSIELPAGWQVQSS
jgi:hypothetical protein